MTIREPHRETTEEPLHIFLNYRREDASGHAGRLYDALADRFGPDNVFMDVDTIRLGSDFAAVIEGAVKQCDVVVAVIGRRWLDAEGADGRRRLDDPEDFVRLELESALANDLFVIPAAVQGAAFPAAQDLPPGLEALARRQGIELRDTAWHDDINRLVRRLELLTEEPDGDAAQHAPPTPAVPRGRRRPLLIALALVALAGAATGLALALGSGGSGSSDGSAGTGASASNSPAKRRLLAAIPAVVRPTCRSIPYGDRSALASLECAGANLSVTYDLFPSAAVLAGWYTEKRDSVGISPGSGACKPTSFRGDGSYAGGKYICFVDHQGAPTIIWTEARADVGATANIYRGKGPSAAASLLRQWRCCLGGPA